MALPQDETTTEQPSIDYEALGLEPVSEEELFGGRLQAEAPETPKAETPEIDYEALGLEPVSEKELFGFEMPKEEPEAPSDWDTLRGLEVSMRQVPQLAYGVAGLVGATSEEITGYGEALRDWGFRGYKEWEESMEPISKETDDITVAWDRAKNGDVGALVDWAQYGIGYGLGQLGETAAVAILGGIAGGVAGAPAGGVGAAPAAAGGAIVSAASKQGFKALAKNLVEKAIAKQAANIATREAEKRGIKLTAEQITKEASQAAIKRRAAKEIGSDVAVFGNAIGMQLGSIYGEAESKAQAEGRDLTGYDLARVWGTGLATGGLEGVVDKFGLDLLKGKLSAALPEGRLAGAAVAGGVGTLGEAGTEAIQTVGERIGAGKDILSDEAINEYINAAALGGLAGGGIGGVGGFISGNQRENAAAKAKVAAEASKNIAPESSKLVSDQADAVINEVAQETPDERVARLQREAQEAAGEIELEEEVPVSGLPPVEPTPPVTPTPEAAVAPVEPVVPAEGAAEPTAAAAPTEPVAPTEPAPAPAGGIAIPQSTSLKISGREDTRAEYARLEAEGMTREEAIAELQRRREVDKKAIRDSVAQAEIGDIIRVTEDDGTVVDYEIGADITRTGRRLNVKRADGSGGTFGVEVDAGVPAHGLIAGGTIIKRADWRSEQEAKAAPEAAPAAVEPTPVTPPVTPEIIVPEERETEYAKSAEAGDIRTAQSLADTTAKEAGYLVHVFNPENKDQILKNGLIASIPQDMPNEPRGVYLFNSKEEAEDAIMNWLGDRFPDDVEPEIIYVSAAGLPTIKTTAGFETIVESNIPPERLKSAEPIVYDDNGNVVPLSQRFAVTPSPATEVAPTIPQLEPLRRVARAEQTEEDVAGLVDAGFAEVYKGQPLLTQAGLEALPEAERPRLTPEARKIQIDTRTSEAAAEAISKNLRIGVDQVPVDVRMPAGWTLVGDVYVPPQPQAVTRPEAAPEAEPEVEAAPEEPKVDPINIFKGNVRDAGFKYLTYSELRKEGRAQDWEKEGGITIDGSYYPTAVIGDTKVAFTTSGLYVFKNQVRELYESDVDANGNTIFTIQRIVTPEDKRGQGSASKALSQITDAADKAGLTLQLQPAVIRTLVGKGGELSAKQLVDWYKRNGFVQKFEGSDAVLIRSPKPTAPAIPEEVVPPRKPDAEPQAAADQEIQSIVEKYQTSEPTARMILANINFDANEAGVIPDGWSVETIDGRKTALSPVFQKTRRDIQVAIRKFTILERGALSARFFKEGWINENQSKEYLRQAISQSSQDRVTAAEAEANERFDALVERVVGENRANISSVVGEVSKPTVDLEAEEQARAEKPSVSPSEVLDPNEIEFMSARQALKKLAESNVISFSDSGASGKARWRYTGKEVKPQYVRLQEAASVLAKTNLRGLDAERINISGAGGRANRAYAGNIFIPRTEGSDKRTAYLEPWVLLHEVGHTLTSDAFQKHVPDKGLIGADYYKQLKDTLKNKKVPRQVKRAITLYIDTIKALGFEKEYFKKDGLASNNADRGLRNAQARTTNKLINPFTGKEITTDDMYALADMHEFYAQAWNSESFQDILKQIKVEPQKSAFQKFVDIIKDILGFESDTMAYAVIDTSLRLASLESPTDSGATVEDRIKTQKELRAVKELPRTKMRWMNFGSGKYGGGRVKMSRNKFVKLGYDMAHFTITKGSKGLFGGGGNQWSVRVFIEEFYSKGKKANQLLPQAEIFVRTFDSKATAEEFAERLASDVNGMVNEKYGSLKKGTPQPPTRGKPAPRPAPTPEVREARIERDPEVQKAAQDLRAGTINRDEYQRIVDMRMPLRKFEAVPTPATNDDMLRGLGERTIKRKDAAGNDVVIKKTDIIQSPESIAEGTVLEARLDIPAYESENVWVVSLHRPRPDLQKGAAAQVVAYTPTSVLRNVTFGVTEKAAAGIAAGKPKSTIATMRGEYVPMTAEQAYELANTNKDQWVEIGMNPVRHSYFYDKDTQTPVVSAEEVVQVGGMVLAKNPVFGKREDYLYARRVQMGRAGMEQAAVEARLQELGFPTGGIIRVVNEPDADFEGRTIILDGKVTGIELNASAMRDNATIDRVLNHEFAESANADGALNKLVERLTPKEKKEINDTITRLRYEERARTAEEAARAIETLAEAWKGRGFFTRAVARVEAWASKLGFKLTRRAAEYIAARNLADINSGFRTAYNRFINVKGEAREGRAFVTPEENARFLELAKDPEANREELQRMADTAAKRGPFGVASWHGSPTGRQIKKDKSFDPAKLGATTGAGSAKEAFFFAKNIGTSAEYAIFDAAEAPFGDWFWQPKNLNDLLGHMRDLVFGATVSGNKTTPDASLMPDSLWQSYGEAVKKMLDAQTPEERRKAYIDFRSPSKNARAYEDVIESVSERANIEAIEAVYEEESRRLPEEYYSLKKQADEKRTELKEIARPSISKWAKQSFKDIPSDVGAKEGITELDRFKKLLEKNPEDTLLKDVVERKMEIQKIEDRIFDITEERDSRVIKKWDDLSYEEQQKFIDKYGAEIQDYESDATSGSQELAIFKDLDEQSLPLSVFEWGRGKEGEQASVDRYYLKMENPLVKRFEGYRDEKFIEIINKAKAEGYDSVIFENIRDGGGFDTIYAVFTPEQIKSADPVTYDDQGNVIPLEQRFQPATTDIRYARREVRESRREPEAIPTFTEGTPEAATLKEMEASMAKVDAASEAKGGKPETYKISEIASVWMDSGLGERELQDAIVEYTNLTPANAAKVAKAIARQYDIQQSIATAFLETPTGLSVEAIPEGATLPPEVDPDRPKPVMVRLFETYMGVKVPPTKLTVNEKTALRDQIRLKAAANREAKKAQQATQSEVIDIIKAMELRGPVRPKQAAALAKRAAKVIWTSEKSMEAFVNYAEKVVINTNYDADLREAKAAQKRAQQLSKSDKVAAPQREVLADIAKIGVNMLDNPAEFAVAVNHYLRGFKSVVSPDYVVIPDAEITSYLSAMQTEADANKAEFDRATNERLAIKYGIPLNELEKYLNAENIIRDLASYARREVVEGILTEKAQETLSGLKAYDQTQLRDEQRKILDEMVKVDPRNLDSEERQRFVRIGNNIIFNNQTNGAEYFVATAKGQQMAREMAKDETAIAKNKAWVNLLPSIVSPKLQRGWALELQSVADTFRNAFGKGAMGKVYRMMGMLDLNMAQTKANTQLDQIQEEISAFYNGLEKKYKAAARNQDGILAEGVVGFLIQKVPEKGETESLAQRRNLIQQDIRNRREDPDRVEMANRIEALLQQLDGATVQDILNNLKQNYRPNYDSLMFLKDTLFPKYKEFLKRFDENFNDQANNYENPDYLPIGFVRAGPSLAITEEETGQFYDHVSLRPKQSSYTIKRADYTQLPTDQSTNTPKEIEFNLRRNAFDSLSDQITKAYTNPAWQRINAFLKTPESIEVFGGRANRDFFIERLNRLRLSRMRRGALSRGYIEKTADVVSVIARKLGTGIALGGVYQTFKQAPDQLITTLATTGRRDLLGQNAMDVLAQQLAPKTLRESTKMLNKFSIGRRGDASAGYKYINQMEGAQTRMERYFTESKWDQAKEQGSKIADIWMVALKKSDFVAAAGSWLTYYRADLAKRGIKFEGWEREAELVDTDPARQDAAAYAEQMTDIYQGSSDPTQMATFAQSGKSGWENLWKSMFVPFNSFAVQQRMRLYSDARDALTKTGVDQKTGYLGLSGTIGGMILFHMVKRLFIPVLSGAGVGVLYGVMGVDVEEPDEEKKKEDLNKRWRQMQGEILANMLVGGTGQIIEAKTIDAFNYAAYLISVQTENESVLDDSGEIMPFSTYVKERSPFWRYQSFDSAYSLGMLEIGLGQAEKAVTQSKMLMDSEEMENFTPEEQRLLYFAAVSEWLYTMRLNDADLARLVDKARRDMIKAVKDREKELQRIRSGR